MIPRETKKVPLMKIYIKQIPPEGLILEETLSASDLDLDEPNIDFIEPINLRLKVSRITDVVIIDGQMISKIHTLCSRCLADLNLDFDQKLNFNYSVREMEDCIDPTDDIRQEIILDYPLKPLCKSDCKGLCPKCGKNINEGGCSCGIT